MTAYRTIDVEATTSSTARAAIAAGTTLLLLHGFPSSSAQYERLMRRLEDRFHVVAPDYPGFGQSPALRGTTTFDRLADVIDAFTQAIGLERFGLYMFDFGAPGRIPPRHASPRASRGAGAAERRNAYEVGLGPACRR